MLFTSFEFMLLFLPLAVVTYFLLNRRRLIHGALLSLIGYSLWFYADFKFSYLFVLGMSVVVNYAIGSSLTGLYRCADPQRAGHRKMVLVSGIVFNVLLLGYFKYTNFLIANLNLLPFVDISPANIVLPLAISFFTFQQIAYLYDAYVGGAAEYSFARYVLFVCFFPQLIAGPIVHHREMMPQFKRLRNKLFSWRNFHKGLSFFIVGLFKKAVIADTFAMWATAGHSDTAALHFFSGWGTSLSYTIQLYFDFSGYADMAIGLALMFNIKLPLNFDSPYRSLNIQEFWHRWHITLSRFLRDYLYIPLGGNRLGAARTYFNLFVVFFIGGIWHGAGWTFVIWGAMHGVGICLHRWWKSSGRRMPATAAWVATFLFVNVAWVFFRADSAVDAVRVLEAMCGMNGVVVYRTFDWAAACGARIGPEAFSVSVSMILMLVFIVQDTFYRNSQQWVALISPRLAWTAVLCGLLVTSVVAILDQQRVSEFIYWQF